MLNLRSAAQLLQRLPIRDRTSSRIIPFNLNYNQQIMLDCLARRAEDGHPLPYWYIAAKARRVGVSSLTEGMLFCDCMARANIDNKIVAHLSNTSEALFRVPLDLAKGLPFPLHKKPTSTEITFRHAEGNSTLTIATAGTFEGGRGTTLGGLHYSEAAFVGGKGSFTSLVNAVSRARGSIVGIESTANGKIGVGKEFYDFWTDAVAGVNDFLPIFLSWLNDPECFRHPEEAKDAPADDDEKDILQLTGCEAKCLRCDQCFVALGRIAWRRWAIHNLCKGYVETFHQEYPTNADEAFLMSGNPAFTRDELRSVRSLVREPIEGILTIADPTQVPEVVEPEFTETGDLYQPKFPTRTGTTVVFHQTTPAPLRIWKIPQPGYHYYIGADAARGISTGDFAAACVWCGETGELVARFSNRTAPEGFSRLLSLLGRYYNNAMIAIELTGNLGLWVQTHLRDTQRYYNFYRWRGRDDKSPVNGPIKVSSTIGWETNVRTRDLMLASFRAGIRESRALPHDRLLLAQMDAADMDTLGRWRVDDDIHDDILVAAMVGWMCKEQWHYSRTITHSVRQVETERVPGADGKVLTPADANAILSGAQLDALLRQRAHWNMLQKYIKRGGPPVNRLEGL